MAGDVFLTEIQGQPDALRRAGAGIRDQREAFLRIAKRQASSAGPLVLTGMGSSYDACYAAATALAQDGVLATMVDAAELLHFRQAALTPQSLVVIVSQSGESAEVVRLVQELRGRAAPPFVVSVTNGLGNPLATAADVALDTHAGAEAGPSSMTFAAALVVLATLARVLGGAATSPPDRVVDDAARAMVLAAEAAGQRAEALLQTPEATADRMAAWLADRPTLTVLGRGSARAAAEMAALTLKEAVGMAVESLETAAFRHGPLELAGPDLAVAIIDLEPATADLDRALAEELRAHDAAVLLVSSRIDAPTGVPTIAVGQLERVVAPAVALIPLQLLAWRLALAAGRKPGEYVRATKVTRRE